MSVADAIANACGRPPDELSASDRNLHTISRGAVVSGNALCVSWRRIVAADSCGDTERTCIVASERSGTDAATV